MSNMITSTASGNLLPAEAAKIYLSLGMELLAVHPLSKAPVSSDWPTRPGVTDPAQAGFVFLDPEQNIGFKPGELFAVIDIDTKHGGKGQESWNEVNERLGLFPDTVKAITASGGGLRIYRVPAGAGLTFQEKMLGLPDLEFRVGAVNCILPPSRVRYKAGVLGPEAVIGQHKWEEGHAPGEIEFAELPTVVIEALRAYEPEAPAVSGGGAVAEYLSAEFKAQTAADPRPAEFAPIREGCAFIKRADECPQDLTEPEWYPVLSITTRCRDGENISHLISKEHPGYDEADTARKMVQAHRASGPRSCANIKNKLRFKGCERCPFWGVIKSPINLGQLPPKPRAPRTKEVTPYELLKRVKIQSSMVYDGETDRVFRPASGDLLKGKAFAAMVRAKVGRNPVDTMLSWGTTPRVVHLDYLPGDPRLMIERPNSDPWCNTWVPGGPKAIDNPEAGARIMHHFEVVIPDDLSRNYVLDYLAHLIQQPGIKIKNAIVLTGEEGYGKSTIGELLVALFGALNARVVGGKQLSSRFKDSLINCQVIAVEEANHGERFEVTEDLKQWFTGEVFPVEGKAIPFHDGRTPRGIFIYSNHEAPLVVGPGSRRFMIVATTREKPSAAYFNEIYAAIQDAAVVAAFKHALLTRDIRQFNPHAEPPRTGAREAAEEASRTPLAQILSEAVREGCFHRDIITAKEAFDVVMKPRFTGMVGTVTMKRVTDAIKAIGGIKVGVSPDGTHRQITPPGGRPERFWAICNADRWRNADDEAIKTEYMRLPDLTNIVRGPGAAPAPTSTSETPSPKTEEAS